MNGIRNCDICGKEVGERDRHDFHEEGRTHEFCDCDFVACQDCCPECRESDELETVMGTIQYLERKYPVAPRKKPEKDPLWLRWEELKIRIEGRRYDDSAEGQ